MKQLPVLATDGDNLCRTQIHPARDVFSRGVKTYGPQGTRFQAGFSVMELLVGMTIVITVGIVAFAFANSTITMSGFLSRRTFAQQDARKVLEAFSREFRETAASAIGAYPIEAASSTALVFFSDTDSDGFVERIRYFADGAFLKKGTTRPDVNDLRYDPGTEQVKTLVQFIANPSVFAYYDGFYIGGGPALPDPADPVRIRYVVLTLTIDENPGVAPDALVLQTTVTSRNLKDNL